MDNRIHAQEWRRLGEMDLSSAKAIRDFILNIAPQMAQTVVD